jgi:hypothetical protein
MATAETIDVQFDLDAARMAAQRQIEYNNILKAKKKWVQNHAIYFYQPYPAQERFHRSAAHIRMAQGTNRSGKTEASVAEDVALCLGFRPWMLPDDLKTKDIKTLMEMYTKGQLPKECLTNRKAPQSGIIIEDDWQVADEILLTGKDGKPAKLRKYIPPGALIGGSLDKQEKNAMGYICKINFINGSTLFIDTEKSFVNNPLSFEGKAYDFVHYDEPKCRALRVAIKRGLVDTAGLEIFSLTPLAEPWMYDEIYMRAAPDTDIEAFYFDAAETIKAGFVSEKGWKDFVDTLTEDEKEARVQGKWVHLKGLVYKEFKARHVKEGGHIIDPIDAKWIYENATLVGSIDPHPRIPMASLFVAADKHNRLIVWDELYMKALVKQFCEAIKAKLAVKVTDKRGASTVEEQAVNIWLCDPLAWQEDPIDGKTWAMEFIDNDIPVEKAPKRKSAGILAVKEAFVEDRLFVCSNCSRFLYEIQHYTWAEWRNPEGRAPKEQTIDENDHLMECLYRAVLMEPKYIEREAYSKPIPDGRRCV